MGTEVTTARPANLMFSHMGLSVRDMGTMERFYTEVLGFTVTDRGNGGGMDLTFLSRDPMDHHQIVLANGRPDEMPANTQNPQFGPSINQISFKMGSLADLRDIAQRLEAGGGSSLFPAITAWRGACMRTIRGATTSNSSSIPNGISAALSRAARLIRFGRGNLRRDRGDVPHHGRLRTVSRMARESRQAHDAVHGAGIPGVSTMWIRSGSWLGTPRDAAAFRAAIDDEIVPMLKRLPGVADAQALWPRREEAGAPAIACQMLVHSDGSDAIDRMLAFPRTRRDADARPGNLGGFRRHHHPYRL